MSKAFTLSGLALVAKGACSDGKRLFLKSSGIKNPHLRDAELDIVCAARTSVITPALVLALCAADMKALLGHVGWMKENDLWGAFKEAFADPAVQQLLVPLLSDKDSDVRRAAAQALAATAGDPAVQQLLVPLLSDKDSDVRWAAA